MSRTAEPSTYERIVATHRSAVAFFRAQLRNSPAETYLRSRLGVIPPGWPVGYAPSGGHALVRYLRRRRFTNADVIDAGLARVDGGSRLVDRFRDRVVFPVYDASGQPVGFVGRACPPAGCGPKYLNTPATTAFVKSRLLFGLAEQRRVLAAGARPVLVEGPMDVLAIAIADAGRASFAAVAPGGTAVTADHLRALAEVGDRSAGFVVALDADQAGRRATMRLWSVLVHAGLATAARAAALPPGTDPADLLTTAGAEALLDAIGAASAPLVDALAVDVTQGFATADAPKRVGALHRAAEIVVSTGRADDMVRLAPLLAHRLNLPYSTVNIAMIDALTAASCPQAPALSTNLHDRIRGPRTGTMG
jgi:DNA primase